MVLSSPRAWRAAFIDELDELRGESHSHRQRGPHCVPQNVYRTLFPPWSLAWKVGGFWLRGEHLYMMVHDHPYCVRPARSSPSWLTLIVTKHGQIWLHCKPRHGGHLFCRALTESPGNPSSLFNDSAVHRVVASSQRALTITQFGLSGNFRS